MNPLHHYLIENAPRFIPVVTIRTQAKELKTTTQAPHLLLVLFRSLLPGAKRQKSSP